MPSRERVQSLITCVEEGRILDAIDSFYSDDVVMQDNLAPATVGLAANRARLSANVDGIQEVREHRAVRVLVDGDSAVIHWHFAFTLTDGTRLRFDQLALQTWRGQDADARIVHERFVFDPTSLADTPASEPD